MNPLEDRPELRELFTLQAAGVQVRETSRLSELTDCAHPNSPGRMRGGSRVLMVAAAAVVVVSGLIGIGVWRAPEARDLQPTGDSTEPDLTTIEGPGVLPIPTDGAIVSAPAQDFPAADPEAKNFLITGADNNACVDPDSPYAPAFANRENIGERSDTIMMWRVNPSTSQVAVLSFARDLFVDISGSSRKGRINEAYERDNPQTLINTIYNNFGIVTDHYIQVDFCAFKTLVDAVRGVSVPFATPVRDANTGLNVPEAGCYTFDGDHALAYVRSRKLEIYTPETGWAADPTSDLGRISRQQDFMRRTLTQVLDKGAFNPDVAGALIETMSDYIVTDPSLTPRRMLELAGVLSHVDPTAIATYQIETSGRTIQGNSVLEPILDSDNMQAILAVFQGLATLAEAPEAVSETATTETSASATLPVVAADENVIGVTPDVNQDCP